VDLDEDGALDILSGSYSRHDGDMAGVFQVLRGQKDGSFAKAAPLCDADGEPLILPGDEEVDRICTRPFAADLDGDGKLDLVSGNFRGRFALFRGEGKGKFAPEASWLRTPAEPDGALGKDLVVSAHGDPFLVDWDGDGDLDMLSGSAQGGAFLFPNVGSRTEPRFGKRAELLEPAGHGATSDRLGDAHLKAPSDSTRLWVDDLNGDGKLDLLVGDNVTLYFAQKDVSEATAKQKLGEWRAALAALSEEEFSENYERLENERDVFVRQERTGFVWAYYRK
jgi:VCBS repeat protein